MSPAGRASLTIVVALLVGATANIVLNTQVGDLERSLRTHDSGELSFLARAGQNTVREKYAFPAALHDVAEGGVLIVPEGTQIGRFHVANLSGVTVVVQEYDPQITARLAIELDSEADMRFDGALHPDGEVTSIAIVAEDDVPDGTRFRLLFFEAAALVVDERILSRVAP